MISDRLPYINTSDRTGTCDRQQLSNSFYANKMISDGLLHINPSDRLVYTVYYINRTDLLLYIY